MAEIERIKGDTWRIVTPKITIPFYRTGERTVILMDSGFPDEYEQIRAALDEKGLQVTDILTSHAHYDHVGNHIPFQSEGARLWLSEFDAGVTKNYTALSAPFYTENPDDLKRLYPFMIFETDRCFSVREKRICAGSDECETGKGGCKSTEAVFEVLDIPGHAHSQTGFVTPDGVAYLADALFSESMLRPGILLFHHNWAQTLKTLGQISQMQYDRYVLAHSGVYTDIRPLAEKNREFLMQLAGTALDLFSDWISAEQFLLRMLTSMNIHPKSPTKYHIADRECHSLLTYLEEEEQLQCKIELGRMLYKRK